MTFGARTQLRLYYRKSAVDGFELRFQLAIDFLQRPNAESESRHDSFVREPLPLLQILARTSRRGITNLHELVPEGFRSVEPGRRYLRATFHSISQMECWARPMTQSPELGL